MAHKKPHETKTAFFAGVTPTSVQSDWRPFNPLSAVGNEDPISEKYHAACIQLASWFESHGGGSDWADHSAGANFFWMRFHLLRSAIGWETYDWGADTNQIAKVDAAKLRAKQQAARVAKLIRAANQAHASAIDAKPQAALGAAIAELRRAKSWWDARASGKHPCHRGPIFYPDRPRSFCSKVIAVSVYLADLAARASKGQNPDLENRRRPDLDGHVPWEAVRQFAIASVGSSNDEPSKTEIQHRINKAVKGDIRLRGWWSPNL